MSGKSVNVSEIIMNLLVMTGFVDLVRAYGYNVNVVGNTSKFDDNAHTIFIVRSTALDSMPSDEEKDRLIRENEKFRHMFGITQSDTVDIVEIPSGGSSENGGKVSYTTFQHKVVLKFHRGAGQSIEDYADSVALAVGSTIIA